TPRPPTSTLFPYTTLFRSSGLSEKIFHHILDLRHHLHFYGVVVLRKFVLFRDQDSCETEFFSFNDPLLHPGDGSYLPCQAYFSRSEEHTSELQSRENLVCR